MIPGVMLGDKHSYNDYGLWLQKKKISSPVPKTKYVDVPGSDGTIDLSEVVSGGIRYKDRTIEMQFWADVEVFRMETIVLQIQNDIAGKQIKIVFDVDNAFYWKGRVTEVTPNVSERNLVTITIKATVEPFKYAITSSAEDWLWDPFDFEQGFINETKDLRVTTEHPLSVRLYGIYESTCPVINVEADEGGKGVYVVYKHMRYDLVDGKNTVYDIVLESEDDEMTFFGDGLVTIDFRGGRL